MGQFRAVREGFQQQFKVSQWDSIFVFTADDDGLVYQFIDSAENRDVPLCDERTRPKFHSGIKQQIVLDAENMFIDPVVAILQNSQLEGALAIILIFRWCGCQITRSETEGMAKRHLSILLQLVVKPTGVIEAIGLIVQ